LAPRDSFLLRTDPALLDALKRWAKDELRSANAQLEFVLRRALTEAGRLPRPSRAGSDRESGSVEGGE
jgi:hypothetical protein